MDYSIYAESTPNPLVMKFVANKILLNKNLEILNMQEAKQMPLAAAIFNFPFVKGIFISGNFIAITKNETVKWDDIAIQLRVFISDFLNTEGVEVNEKNMEKEAITQSVTEEKIFSNLETKVGF